MQLRVKPRKRKDEGSGLAAIDREAMSELGVTSGEFVAIEGLEDVVVIAATNRPDLIDDALLRQGRLDRHVAVEAPDEDARREIFEVHTRDRPLADDVDPADLAARTDGYVGADVEAVCREAATAAVREHVAGDGDVADIVLTGHHLEAALAAVEPRGGDPAGRADAQAEPAGSTAE